MTKNTTAPRPSTNTLSDIAQKSRSWPFEEAKAIVKRMRALNRGQITTPTKGYVLFETGYGPSGLPHIGTFQEVARTAMVMQAFQTLHPEIPTKLICFSDDMDGFRKIPGNVPNAETLRPYVELKSADGTLKRDPTPLTSVPDPYETHDSFGAHNNDRLKAFLDQFGFDYDFKSSTVDCYAAGTFNDGLIKILKHWDEICEIVGEILGDERKATYCPLFPVVTRPAYEIGGDRKIILHNVRLEKIIDLEKGIAEFTVLKGPYEGEVFEHCVLNGGAKAQWRVDWALRWFALDVDYEMAGVDLTTAADIAGNILKLWGTRIPAGFRYQLFLDEDGQKISKSKGNGLSMEDWLKYAPHESLSYYIFQRPTSAKKLHFDVIPKAVDEYIAAIEKMPTQLGDPNVKIFDNPAWYIHNGAIPNAQHTPVSFNLLLNLASVANATDKDTLWGFIKRYAPDAAPDSAPFLDRLVGYAVAYFNDFVKPHKTYRAPDARERAALSDLATRLNALGDGHDLDTIQTEVFSAGKENGYDKSELRDWFQALYQVLLGQDEGPRFGSFVQVYGAADTVTLIQSALDGTLAKAA